MRHYTIPYRGFDKDTEAHRKGTIIVKAASSYHAKERVLEHMESLLKDLKCLDFDKPEPYYDTVA